MTSVGCERGAEEAAVQGRLAKNQKVSARVDDSARNITYSISKAKLNQSNKQGPAFANERLFRHKRYVGTCSEPLLWTCNSCAHSFHADEWQNQGRQCPACLEKSGSWKCSLCLETFSQPTLQGERQCKRKKENDNPGSSMRARSELHPWISAGVALMAWLHKTRLGWGVILLFLGISTGGLGVYQFIKHDRSARQEPDVRNPRPTSSVQNEKAGEAEYKRGVAYLQGEGVPKNEEEAVKWLAKGAEQGDARAQTRLGNCYQLGTGVVKDEQEAVKWYAKAAAQGHARAQTGLGFCYYFGSGVVKDEEEAVKWHAKAAAQGNAVAQNTLGVCYQLGTGVVKDEQEAVKWHAKAAAQGYAEAQTCLGVCYENGTGVLKDEQEAVKWYAKAAAQGNAGAQTCLGVCYKNGTGVVKDEQEAVRWYAMAAEQGNAQAQYELGVCYENGEGIPVDLKEAFKWYTRAAELGFALAKERLRQR